MEQQHVVRPTVGEQVLDLRLDNVCRFVAYHVHVEAADLRVAEHPGQRLRVRRGSEQMPQPLVVILIAGHDQGPTLTVH